MKKHHILDTYKMQGFIPARSEHWRTLDDKGRIIPMLRRQKKAHAQTAEQYKLLFMTNPSKRQGICPVAILKSICSLSDAVFLVKDAAR
jgi:hypothetical protein